MLLDPFYICPQNFNFLCHLEVLETKMHYILVVRYLKIGKIIPVYKKGNNKLIDNYRPISLLPTISRIFEMTIYCQLYEYIEHHHIINDSQYGFKKAHSTLYTATELIDCLTYKLDYNKIPFNIYIDLSKAFDTLNYSILLSKLHYYSIKHCSHTTKELLY